MGRLHDSPAGLKSRPTAARQVSAAERSVSAAERLVPGEQPFTPRCGSGRPARGREAAESNDRVASGSRAAFGLLAAAALFLLPACAGTTREEGAAPDVPTIEAQVGQVVRQDLVERLTVRGTITASPNQDVRVSALVPGRVTMLHVAEGDAVAAGQVVAEIDPRPFEDQKRQAEAGLLQARAALDNAKLAFDRTDRLFKRGIAAGKEVEDAQTMQATAGAGVQAAEAALDTANRQLARTKVASPIAGRVVKRMVSVGEQVDGTAAQPLLEVANVRVVEMAANVPSEQLAAVTVGQAVDVVTDAYGERVFRGEVIAVAPAVDPTTNAALTRVRVQNPNAALKVGMFAQARIVVGERKGVLTVPPTAIALDESGQAAVYVVSGDMARRVPVRIGLETTGAVELLSGVSEGQAILTTNVHGLAEKARLGKAS